jgi:hypothetical protein
MCHLCTQRQPLAPSTPRYVIPMLCLVTPGPLELRGGVRTLCRERTCPFCSVAYDCDAPLPASEEILIYLRGRDGGGAATEGGSPGDRGGDDEVARCGKRGHKGRELEYFCMHCEVPVCQSCVALEHAPHR